MEKRFPIRQILGMSYSSYGGSIVKGMLLVFEEGADHANQLSVTDHDNRLKLIRFINDGPSEVVYEVVEKNKLFGGTKQEWNLKEIRIRRDWQFANK